jgi:hypothetical protein
VLEDVVEFLNLHPLEGVEHLLQFLHVVFVPTQSHLYLRLVLNALERTSLDKVRVLNAVL